MLSTKRNNSKCCPSSLPLRHLQRQQVLPIAPSHVCLVAAQVHRQQGEKLQKTQTHLSSAESEATAPG